MWLFEKPPRTVRIAGMALLWCCAVAPELPARPVELSHRIESGGALRVDCSHGNLRVVAGAAGVVRVTGTVDDELDGARLWREAGALEVRVKFPLMRRIRNLWEGEPRYEVDLVIEVPADTRLFLVSRDAAVTIAGLTGPVGVGVVSSSVEITGEPARLEVETVTGSLHFAGATTSLRATTMSGELEARGVDGRAHLEAVSGSIVLADSSISTGELTTVSGDVAFDGQLTDDGELVIETDSGNVTLECCGEQATAFDLQSRHGEIVNEADEARPITDRDGRRRLSLPRGDGRRLVEVSTRSGLIRLRR